LRPIARPGGAQALAAGAGEWLGAKNGRKIGENAVRQLAASTNREGAIIGVFPKIHSRGL